MKANLLFPLLALLICLSSCNGYRHANFNRQKYTDLKTRTTDETQTQFSTVKTYETISTSIDEKIETGNHPEQFLIAENDNQIETERTEKSTIEYQTAQSKLMASPATERPERTFKDRTTAYEKQIHLVNHQTDTDEKKLANFHLLFQIGLMLFIISLLLFAMAWFSASFGMMVLCLVGADLTILSVWIISFVLIGMGKKISKSERDDRFKLEYILAWFTACAGPFVALGVIVLGFIIVLIHF